MNTFYELWGTISPEHAKLIIESQKFKGIPTNLEEQALLLVGKDIYETLIKDYTEKQWGRSARQLPTFIINRLPLRFTFDNNYFNDKHQGIPIGGYTKMFEKMLDSIEIKLETDYFLNKEYFNSLASTIVYTGCIDEFFDYEYGELEYRSLKFNHKIMDTENYQGNAVINYCQKYPKQTRTIEHKHFEKLNTEKTVVTYEYPEKYSKGMIPYYPINDEINQKIYKQYQEKSKSLTNFIFGGRLSEYKYMDMHVVIESAISALKKTVKN
jgi:UDP-galactopyranose mutase